MTILETASHCENAELSAAYENVDDHLISFLSQNLKKKLTVDSVVPR